MQVVVNVCRYAESRTKFMRHVSIENDLEDFLYGLCDEVLSIPTNLVSSTKSFVLENQVCLDNISKCYAPLLPGSRLQLPPRVL
jgi:hypothetical protein